MLASNESGPAVWRRARLESPPTADAQLALLELELVDAQIELLQLEAHLVSRLENATRQVEMKGIAPSAQTVLGPRRRRVRRSWPQSMHGQTLAGWGRAPLGWAHTDQKVRGGKLVAPVADEVATIRRMVALRRLGSSFRRIALELAREGRKTKNGGHWHAETVRKVLRARRPVEDFRAPG